MREVEIFSPEAFVVGLFSFLLMLSGMLQFMSALKPPGLASGIDAANRRIDRIISTLYEQGKVIPYLLLAAVIAVVAPVYDLYTDMEWIRGVGQEAGQPNDLARPSWAELVQSDPDRPTLPHLIHVIQSAIALLFMWLYSLWWTFAIDRAANQGKAPKTALERGAFISGFGIILGGVSLAIHWMGQNPAFVLKVPIGPG